MKIAIIGAGNVGRALASGWRVKGHEICFGVRDPASPKYAGIDGTMFGVATNAEAVRWADAVVLATPWDATREAIRSCGNLGSKVLLDATNPLLPGLSGLDHADGVSGGEKVAAWAVGAKVAKVFNTTGFNNMANPRYGDARSMMLYCGDESDAKDVARQLAADLGFDPVDFGPLANARYSENLAMSWIWLAIKGGAGRDIAFVLAKR